MPGFLSSEKRRNSEHSTISDACIRLGSILLRSELGKAVADIVLTYAPKDLKRMKVNFSDKIETFSQDYKRELEESIAAFLDGTYQTIRLTNQQGSFEAISLPVREDAWTYWSMVKE